MDKQISRLQSFMAAPPWLWTAALPNLEDFAKWTPRRRSYVIHTPLVLPTESWNYIERLDFDRDFTHLPNNIFENQRREIVHHIAGWHESAAQTDNARTAFAAACTRFFPDAPERKTLIHQLTDITTDFARISRCNTLACELKAFGKGFRWKHFAFHRDHGYLRTGAIYLRGPTTAFATPARQTKHINGTSGKLGYHSPPERSIAMWPYDQYHESPGTEHTRIGIFLLARHVNQLT